MHAAVATVCAAALTARDGDAHLHDPFQPLQHTKREGLRFARNISLHVEQGFDDQRRTDTTRKCITRAADDLRGRVARTSGAVLHPSIHSHTTSIRARTNTRS